MPVYEAKKIMQTLNLLKEEIGTISEAALLINDFHWFLSIDELADQWIVKTGETVVFTADSREAVDAFLYGMALAYKGLPAHLYAKLFSMMAGIDLPDANTIIDIDFSDDADDERLSDLSMNQLEEIEAHHDDDIFPE